jgi:hypothetical protein
MQKTVSVFRHFFNFSLIPAKTHQKVCKLNDGDFDQILGLRLKNKGGWIGIG